MATDIVYTLSNNGFLPLQIQSIAYGTSTNCTAVTAGTAPVTIAVGSSAPLTVRVTPAAAGAWSCRPTIAGSASASRTLSGNAGVAPAPAIVVMYGDTRVDWGIQLSLIGEGELLNLTFDVLNTGSAAATLGSAALSSLTYCSASITTNLPGSLAAGGSAGLVLAVTPSLPPAGSSMSFTVAFTSNDPNRANVSFSVYAQVRASSEAAVELRRDGTLIAFPDPDSLGRAMGSDAYATNLVVGTGSTIAYTLHNVSAGTTLTVTDFTCRDATNCQVTGLTAMPLTVNAGAQATVSFRVTATEAATWSVMPTLLGNFGTNVDDSSGLDPGMQWVLRGNAVSNPRADIQVSRDGLPCDDGGTDSTGSAWIGGQAQVLTYAITNIGAAALTLGTATIGSTVNCTATVTTAPDASVPARSATELAITVTPTAAGAWSFAYSNVTNVTGKNPYNWVVAGTASTSAAPGIVVTRPGNTIADGSTDATGSSWVQGRAGILTYTIANPGTADLTLGAPALSGASGCTVTVTNPPPAGTVAAGSSTGLVLSVTPTGASAWSVQVSFTTNVAGTSPFDWTVTGTARVLLPDLVVLRDGKGIAAGGMDRARWVSPGADTVLTYALQNPGFAVLTLGSVTLADKTNCTAIVTGAPDGTVAAGDGTTLAVTVHPTTVDWSFTVSIPSNVAGKNPFAWTVRGSCRTIKIVPRKNRIVIPSVDVWLDGADTGTVQADGSTLFQTTRHEAHRASFVRVPAASN